MERVSESWRCQIVRMRPGSEIDRLIDDYIRDQALYAHRPHLARAVAIRELLRKLIDRKRRKFAEPEQLGLFSG